MSDEDIEAAIMDRMNWVRLGWNREINEKVIDLAREALRARRRERELESALKDCMSTMYTQMAPAIWDRAREALDGGKLDE